MAGKSESAAAALAEQLARMLIRAEGPFVVSNSWRPPRPLALRFRGGQKQSVERLLETEDTERALRPLLRRCTPATFGKGRATLTDRAVRSGLRLKSEKGAFTVTGFDPRSSGVLGEAEQALGLSDLRAELYDVNVCQRGDHFASHKDTPRGKGMVGTLVVCLPSRFSGGRLTLNHRGKKVSFDWGRDIDRQKDDAEVHWAAFFGDVDHAIERVTSGIRVTLTYRLHASRKAASNEESPSAISARLTEALSAAVRERRVTMDGDPFGIPCAHLYSDAELFRRPLLSSADPRLRLLKGRDAVVAKAALAARWRVRLRPFLMEEESGDEWELAHPPTRGELQALEADIDESGGEEHWTGITPEGIEDALEVERVAFDGEGFDVVWVVPPWGSRSDRRLRPSFSERADAGEDLDDDEVADDEDRDDAEGEREDELDFEEGSDERSPRDHGGVQWIRRGGAPSGSEDAIALGHLFTAPFSTTGYFGNEGGEGTFYTYAALFLSPPRAVRKPAR